MSSNAVCNLKSNDVEAINFSGVGSAPRSHSSLGVLALSLLTGLSSFGARAAFSQESSSLESVGSMQRPHDDPTPAHTERLIPPFELHVPVREGAATTLRAAVEDRSKLVLSYGEIQLQKHSKLPEVQLVDGSRFNVPLVIGQHLKWGVAELKVETEGTVVSVPSAAVRAIRLSPDVTYSAAWDEVSKRDHSADTLYIRRPGGVLDSVTGILKGVDADTVHFEIEGNTLKAPHVKIEGICCFSNAKMRKGPGIELIMPNGRFVCSDVGIQEGAKTGLVASTVAGGSLTSPLVPFRLSRIAVTTHFLGTLDYSVVRWLPISSEALSTPTGLLGIPPKPIESITTTVHGGVRLHGEIELRVKLRGDYERILVGVKEPDLANDTVSFLTEEGEVNHKEVAQKRQGGIRELNVLGKRELTIKVTGVNPVVLDPLLFVLTPQK